MKYNEYGQAYTTEADLCDLLYITPDLDLRQFQVEDPGKYNQSREQTFATEFPILKRYTPSTYSSVEAFDLSQQDNWYMPNEYKNMDIAKFVLDRCQTDTELQRVGQELLMFQERNLFNLLKYLKYFVDTMRANNVVWGLGRGSSVASYVLYLMGVHKINSLYYDLSIEEFLK